jgi:outer membrane lipoprotein-sorting protein
MRRRRDAALLFGLSCAFALAAGTVLAEDGGTTISKSKTAVPARAASPAQSSQPQGLTQPQDQLRPSVPADGTTGAITTGDTGANELPSSGADEGAGWEAAVEAAQGPTPLIGDDQVRAVQKINAYFNGITNLQGSFEQVDPSNKRSTGRFYVQRPGKIRFDYAPPSALRIVADGAFLAIEDSDLKTVEKYPIKSTPFRLLLTSSVDLARDARIVGVESQEGMLAITVEDKTGDAAGRIKLVFDTAPEMKLSQWQITDAQGLTTQVTVSNIVSGRKVAADFFSSTQSFQPFR